MSWSNLVTIGCGVATTIGSWIKDILCVSYGMVILL